MFTNWNILIVCATQLLTTRQICYKEIDITDYKEIDITGKKWPKVMRMLWKKMGPKCSAME